VTLLKHSNGPFGEKVKEVISYQDDVFVWVYLDQVDRVIRYETFVVGYDDAGERSTLDFVLEEGVLDNMHEVPVFWSLLQEYNEQAYNHSSLGSYSFTVDGRLVTPAPLKYFYSSLAPHQLAEVHEYFAAQEAHLKEERCPRWTRMLRALGYDVIPSLSSGDGRD